MDRKTKRLPDPSDVRDNLIAGCCQDCPCGGCCKEYIESLKVNPSDEYKIKKSASL